MSNQEKEQKRTFMTDVKDDINLLVDETHIKDVLHDAKDDVRTIIDETHIKDFINDAKDDLNAIIDETHVEEFLDDARDDLDLILDELEEKAQKIKKKIAQKFSEGKNTKDKVVINTAESLVDAVNKVKCALADCKEK